VDGARSCDALSVENDVPEGGVEIEAGNRADVLTLCPVEEAGSLPLYWREVGEGAGKRDDPLAEGC
jgi:hypothetical protein